MISLIAKKFPIKDIALRVNDMQIADKHLTVPAVLINAVGSIIGRVVELS